METLLKENDIVVIEEHQLYDNELYKLRILQYQITPARDFCNDRICTLMYHLQSNQIVYIIGVYMPQRNCIKDDFIEYLAHIAVLIERNRNHKFIIIGDFNSHFGESASKRAWGKSCKNGKQILHFIDQYSLEI